MVTKKEMGDNTKKIEAMRKIELYAKWLMCINSSDLTDEEWDEAVETWTGLPEERGKTLLALLNDLKEGKI